MHCDIKEWRIVGWATVEQEAIDTEDDIDMVAVADEGVCTEGCGEERALLRGSPTSAAHVWGQIAIIVYGYQ